MRAGLPVYQRGRNLVRPATQEVSVSHGRRALAACFSELTPPAAIDFLSRAADWSRFDGRVKANVPINPPRQIADVMLSRFGDWTFPTLPGSSRRRRSAPTALFSADPAMIPLPGFISFPTRRWSCRPSPPSRHAKRPPRRWPC